MTRANSSIEDNGGRCEACNEPGSEYRMQQTVPVMLGGGLGMGTMWVCTKCKKERDARAQTKTEEQSLTLTREPMPQKRHHWTMEDVCDAKDEALTERTQREREDIESIIATLAWTRAWREREAADVGCGYGRLLPALTARQRIGRVTGFEREEDLVVKVDTGSRTRVMHVKALTDLRYGPEAQERVSDGYFDFVMTFTVLQHLPLEEARAAIQELRRVSRRYILICEETDETLRGLNTAGGYSTWGRPFEWYQIEMARDPHHRQDLPTYRLDHMRPRRVEDGYPRKHCGTYMLFEREP